MAIRSEYAPYSFQALCSGIRSLGLVHFLFYLGHCVASVCLKMVKSLGFSGAEMEYIIVRLVAYHTGYRWQQPPNTKKCLLVKVEIFNNQNTGM